MATTPVSPISKPLQKKKAANGTSSQKSTAHHLTLTFDDKYAALYDELAREADADDRSVSQYVLRFLRDNHVVPMKDRPYEPGEENTR